MRPFAYYSSMQSTVVAGLHQSAQALNSMIRAVEVSEPIILVGTIVLYSPHSIVQPLEVDTIRAVLDS